MDHRERMPDEDAVSRRHISYRSSLISGIITRGQGPAVDDLGSLGGCFRLDNRIDDVWHTKRWRSRQGKSAVPRHRAGY